jgi:hypothetical protein
VKKLASQRLLQNSEKFRRRDQRVVDKDLTQVPFTRNALVQATLALLIGDHLAVDQNLAKGLVK